MSLNKTLLLGNLTRDAELRYSVKGTAYLKFDVAVTTRYEHNGERKEEVAFVTCTCFGITAEKLAVMRKGEPVFVEGRLNLNSWTDKTSGQKRSKLEVMVESAIAVASAGETPAAAPSPAAPPPVVPRPALAVPPAVPPPVQPDLGGIRPPPAKPRAGVAPPPPEEDPLEDDIPF